MHHRWLTLFVTTSAISLVFLNSTILPVALPTIQKELGFTPEGIAWVVNAYLLTLVALVLLGGRLGDIFGLKWIFCLGLVIFFVGSLFCATSYLPFWLVGGRAILGLGGALMLPASGALLIRAFPKDLRGKAVGINVSIGSIFLVAGPIVGGLFAQYLSWRYVFWINLPIAAFGFGAALWILPKDKIQEKSVDWLGALVVACAMGSLIFGIMQGDDFGWLSPITWALLLGGVALFALYGALWKRAKVPIVNLELFKSPYFTHGNVCLFLAQLILMIAVYWAMYFQVELNYSPAGAGALLLFSNIPVMFVAPVGGYLSDKWGPKIPVALGFLLLLFSFLWLITFATGRCFFMLAPSLIAFGCGVPMVLSPSFATAMHHVQQEHLGQAAGVILAVRQFAATFGMAVISALFLSARHLGASYLTAFRISNMFVALLALFGLVFALKMLHNNDEKKRCSR